MQPSQSLPSNSSYSTRSSSVDSSSTSSDEVIIKEKLRPIPEKLRDLLPEDLNVDLPNTGVSNNSLMLIGKAEKNCKMQSKDKSRTREITYKKENKQLVKIATKKTTVTVVKKDAKKNSQVMATSVGIGSLVGCVGAAGGPIGLVAGVAAGAGIGFVVGGIYIRNKITKRLNIHLFTSDHYMKWRNDAIQTKVFPIFKNFINVEEYLEDFLCPITYDIISMPMKAPDGRTYEKLDIEKYIDGKTKDPNKLVESPFKGKEFSKNQLVFDLDYCQRLIKKTSEIYDLVKKVEGRNIERDGLKAVKKNTTETVRSIHEQVELYYLREFSNNKANKDRPSTERYEYVERKSAQWDWRI